MKIDKKIIKITIIATIILIFFSLKVYAFYNGYDTAWGSAKLWCGIPIASVEEYEENSIKYFRVANTGDWECFVRIKVFGVSITNNMLRL